MITYKLDLTVTVEQAEDGWIVVFNSQQRIPTGELPQQKKWVASSQAEARQDAVAAFDQLLP